MFELVEKFETNLAQWFGSTYAVATDSCTHALELCFRLQQIQKTKCPTNTYISIPMMLEKLNIEWNWIDDNWSEYYRFSGTNIIDAAVLWRKNSYISGTMMCLSFQYQKTLSLGRGGMILLDDKQQHEKLIKMSHDGRSRHIPWADQDIDMLGYHYYMTPETAEIGLDRFEKIKSITGKIQNYKNYPNLKKMSVFKNAR